MPKINSLIIVDFETGGLDCRVNAVTEVAAIAIKLDTLEKIDLVSEYVKPYGNYTYEEAALKATGITYNDIEGGLDIKEVVGLLIDLFKRANIYQSKGNLRPIFIAHKSAFDKGFLLQIFNYCKKMADLEKYSYGDVDFYGNYQPEFLDSISLSKLMYGNDEDMTSFNLQNCITRSGIELSDAHKAISDTLALTDMIRNFIHKMRSDGEIEVGAKKTKIRDHFQF